MYAFETKGGDRLALRPEGTASVLRAALEANLHKAGNLPVKLWYSGSYYRYERPQKGRYRHFSQVGAEAIGAEDPALDAELIILARPGVPLAGPARLPHPAELAWATRSAARSTGPRCRTSCAAWTWTRTPCAAPRSTRCASWTTSATTVQKQLAGAPLLRDYLCDACKAYHEEVRELLTAAGVAFEDDPKLVRGLDYYTRTTFEFVHDGLGSQSAVGGGGRYDGLSEMIGGPALPSVGWALGVDRTVLALRGGGRRARTARRHQRVRGAARRGGPPGAVRARSPSCAGPGVAADFAYGGKGLKGAMKAANRSGARFALVAGERDLAEGVVQLKDMESGEQDRGRLNEIVAELESRLG